MLQNCFFCLEIQFPLPVQSKPSLKIGTENAIWWNSLGLFRDYGLNYIFFRNKTFLFFKIESWNLQHLFKKKIRETSQNFNSIRKWVEKNENKNCLNELNKLKFCKVLQNYFSNRCWKFQFSGKVLGAVRHIVYKWL